MKKIIIAGGTGFLGNCLKDHYKDTDTKIVILTRNVMPREENIAYVHWNGRDQGEWSEALEGTDLLINLTGRSVDCRYNKKNKAEIYSSRLDSTTALGVAIARCENPPRLWINSSSATIYRHSLDRDMDEYTGEAGTGFEDPEIIGHIEIRRGQFILEGNADGTTRLVGKSWYRLKVYPVWYYGIWAEDITREVHLRVMEHIRILAENDV